MTHMIYQRQVLKDKLGKGAWWVTFTKKDGTERIIKCTRDKTLLPKELRETINEPPKRKESSAIPVWDLENSDWRSFSAEQVTNIEGV